MPQSTPVFPERVRFNWAFHDGTLDAQSGRVRDVTNHYDPLYATAYRYGVDSFTELQARPETSDEAWAQHEAQRLTVKQEYRITKAVEAGTIKRLYLAGHNHKRGQAVALEYTDAPPVRFYRFNRRFGAIPSA
jgi:hypothetical protein